MKKKLLLVSLMALVLACLFAFSVFAENKIIKHNTLPTLEEIHANRDAYVSHLDAFDGDSLGEIDSTSVVVLSDLAETPTYYVFPSYYYMRTTNNTVWGYLTKLNDAIAAADLSAFAGYVGIGGGWTGGGCKYLIRYEVPTYVTSITGTSKFEGDTNLKEVYFPTHIVIDEETGLEKEIAYVTSISGQNLFSSCSSLEYVHNSEFLPGGLVAGNNDGFASCKSLKEFKIPETATYINSGCFNGCSSLTEITLPKSVVSLGKKAFAGCASLVTFKFGEGFNKFSSPNNDYETFSGASNLKYVYLPATFADNITATKNQFKNIFSINSKATFFLVGSYEVAFESREKFIATEANNSYAKAEIVEYDPDIDYMGYAESLGYSLIVYNYSACEAFYNGEHDVSENYTLEFAGERFLSVATKSKSCSKCIFKVDKSELAPLFTCLGYSSNNQGSIVQGFSIDTNARAEYEKVLGKLEFGVIAAADLRENKEEGADVFAIENNISCNLSNAKFDFFEIKIAGLDDTKLDAYLFFCAYVKLGGECYYINNGITGTTASSITYNLAK